MRIKYIIAAVIALAASIFAVYNWLSYFRSQPSSPQAQVQALRPEPSGEIARLEREKAARDSAGALQEGGQVKSDSAVALQFSFPDTLGRNPFLTPGEIGRIARGDTIEQQSAPPPPQAPVAPGNLPELAFRGVIRDTPAGGYKALIGNKYYSVGDTVGTETVERITKNTVELVSGGRSRVLSVGENTGRELLGNSSIRMKKNQ